MTELTSIALRIVKNAESAFEGPIESSWILHRIGVLEDEMWGALNDLVEIGYLKYHAMEAGSGFSTTEKGKGVRV